ncbi:MAG: carboxypeptidase-like regulatory domain-containing protein [Candidatus Marinimicrobia bacterium]|nr:carboxypeptidase-like regulatory domain-containing protein [Candidatus Neomarinimicrobiota bacterium]
MLYSATMNLYLGFINWNYCIRINTFIIILAFTVASGQSRIDGQIIDKNTGEPLIGVNVFFSKTSIGTTTDKDGLYTIKNISNGRYELVISMIGYSMKKKEINLFYSEKVNLDIGLTPEAIKMKEIRVTKKSNKQWKKDYKVFKKAFLGHSENGKSCKIINEYVLSFKHRENILSALAQRPLIIENKQLGYVITYYLDEFATNNTFLRYDVESFFKFFFVSSTLFVRYSGESFFTKMQPESENEKQRWIRNRQTAYNGSLRHLLTTMGERFDWRYNMKGNHHRERLDWTLISGSKYDPLVIEGFELYPSEVHNEYDYKELLNDSLVWISKNDNELMLSFKDKLMVRYMEEGEELGYAFDPFLGYSKPKIYQTSVLTLGKDSVIFDKKGRYFERFMIEQQEYMGWERVGDQLPFDYLPIQN